MKSSNKILGILLLLIYVCVATALLNDAFIKPYNLQNLLRSSSMFAIIGIGAVLVIVTGGIDLSTGSLIGLVGCTMIMTLKSWSQYPPGDNGAWLVQLIGVELLLVAAGWVLWDTLVKRRKLLTHARRPKTGLLVAGVLLLVVAFWLRSTEHGNWMTMAVSVGVALWLSAHLGLLHGLMITKLGLQPFVVTLCGLMIYRGLSRYLTGDQTQGLGTEYNDSLRLLAIGKPCTATAVMLAVGIVLLLVGMWKSFVSKRSRRDATARSNGLVLLVLGAVTAVVASSRYWDGWTVEFGNTFAQVAGLELKFFTLDLPERAIARPAHLMSFAWIPLIVCFGGLAFLTARRTLGQADRRLLIGRLLPLLVVAGGLAALLAVMNWIGGETITLANMKSAFVSAEAAGSGDRFLLGMNVVLWKMLGVFFNMGVVMGGVLWLGKSWTRSAGNLPRALWIFTLFFAVLWLLSKTAIHETVVQTPFFFLVVIGALAGIFLNTTVFGRYFFALGNNEEAARYSGINTDNMTILAYVLCALCGGFGAVLFTLDSNNVEPSGHGSFYELYAIAAAVLGGSSLRGGEGSILGVIIGASIMRVLYNAPDMIGIASQLEMFTIGIVLLIGIIVDETARRTAAKRDRKTAL